MYSVDNDPNHLLGRPHQYTSKANWHDTRLKLSSGLDVSGGGSIESFANVDDLHARGDYVGRITRSAAVYAEYEYTSISGLFLLRLGHELTPDQASGYTSALKSQYSDLSGPA